VQSRLPRAQKALAELCGNRTGDYSGNGTDVYRGLPKRDCFVISTTGMRLQRWFPMRVSDSSMGGEAGQFRTTRWTLVMASAHNQSQTGRATLAALCRTSRYRSVLLHAGAVIHRMMPKI
jgi:hypothetical protein